MRATRGVCSRDGMLLGFVFWLMAILANVGAFFGARFLAARAVGVPGFLVATGIERRPWADVPRTRRILFTLAGPAGCYLVAAAFVALGLSLSGRDVVDEKSMRVVVVLNGPAHAAGIRDGDKVLAVNEVPIVDWARLRKEVSQHPGEAIRIEVERDGRRMVVAATPGRGGRIGVSAPAAQERVGLVAALGEGLVAPVILWGAVAKGLFRIVAGVEQAEVAGPVGIVRAVGESATPAIGHGFRLVGLLSAYFFWIPTAVAFALFPWRRRGAIGRIAG